MASLETSELLFGMLFFKKFSEFIDTNYNKVYAPSTAAEGNPKEEWAGADLVIDDFCFQLKMAEEIFRNKKIKDAYFNGDNYFQFVIKNKANRQNACQLNLLVDIAKQLPEMEVFYAAPCYGIPNTRKRGQNFWFKNFANSALSDIYDYLALFDIRSIPLNLIENNNKHKVKYSKNTVDNGYGHYFSSPTMLKTIDPKRFAKITKENLFEIDSWADLKKKYQTIDERVILIKKVLYKNENDNNFIDLGGVEFLHYLASEYNIFWLPISVSQQDFDEFKNIKLKEK